MILKTPSQIVLVRQPLLFQYVVLVVNTHYARHPSASVEHLGVVVGYRVAACQINVLIEELLQFQIRNLDLMKQKTIRSLLLMVQCC